jgi:hypothetical protein
MVQQQSTTPPARRARSRPVPQPWRIVLGAVLAANLAGQAQDPPAARAACVASVIRLCPIEALAGDHDGAKRCLFKHLSQASRECQAALAGPPPRPEAEAQSRS